MGHSLCSVQQLTDVCCCFASLLFRLSQHAIIPTRGSAGAAGYDLSSAKDVLVPARGKALCPTDLSIALPEGTYGRVAPRSGLTWKHSLDTGAGVIDADYRGNGERDGQANGEARNSLLHTVSGPDCYSFVPWCGVGLALLFVSQSV
jgi:hypothetical protein